MESVHADICRKNNLNFSRHCYILWYMLKYHNGPNFKCHFILYKAEGEQNLNKWLRIFKNYLFVKIAMLWNLTEESSQSGIAVK
jgi:hypothetical protein